MKDMFIVGGFNAYPAEIEKIMTGHPAVAAVAVVGVPDVSGSARWAWRSSCPPPAPTSTPDELIAWCRENMANYKVPRYVELVDALPLNASNKVLKTDLRDRAAKLASPD